MKICIIHPVIGKESAEELAEYLGADCSNPYQTQRRDYREYDLLFNYGCNRKVKFNRVINKSKSVGRCIDKIKTFEAFTEYNVPHPEYTDDKHKIPKHWDRIAIRKSKKGNQATDLDYAYFGDEIPDAELYTKVYSSKFEFRIVVFMGKVVGRYRKQAKGTDWWLNPVDAEGFDHIDAACIEGAKALEIDYVGFDVLSRGKKTFTILEANSAPILTEEVAEAIKNYIEVQ